MRKNKRNLSPNQDDVASLCSAARIDPSGYRRFGGALKLPLEPDGPSAEIAGGAPISENLPGKGSSEADGEGSKSADTQREHPPTKSLLQPGSARFSNLIHLQARNSLANLYRFASSPSNALPPRMADDVLRKTRLGMKRIVEHAKTQSPSTWMCREFHNLIPVYPIAGGVGTTTVIATLARVLSRTGEQVLMVDGARQPFLNLFFGGVLSSDGVSTYLPNRNSGEGAIHIVNRGNDAPPPVQAPDCEDNMVDEWMWRGLHKFGEQVEHIFVDIWPELPNHAHRFLLSGSFCLSVVAPDLRCLLAISQFLKWIAAQEQAIGHRLEPYFLLNYVDKRVPFHLEVQEQLHQQLGHRLLPFYIPRSDEIPEATAEGMTIVDFVAGSPVVDSFLRLADWIRQLSAQTAVQGA